MDYVLDERPCAVSAIGTAHVPGQPRNLAYLTCLFSGSLIAHFHVNWLAPVKIRQTLIGGERQMIVYDDLEPSEKIKVYDRGITVNDGPEGRHQLLVGYRSGDMLAPQVSTAEALGIVARHFLECIEQDRQPLTDGQVGLRVVQMLEAATHSIMKRGRLVELETTEVTV